MILKTKDFRNKAEISIRHKGSKIVAILLFILSVAALQSNAQEYRPEYHNMTAGLVGGIDFAQVDGDGYKGYDKMGFTAGGVIFMPFGQLENFPLDATIALSMEVLFTQKGSKGDEPAPGVQSQNINLQYAEVPFQLHLYRGPRKTGVGMGLSVGYLAISEETVVTDQGVSLKNGNPFNKFDLNFVLSGNIHLWNGFFLSPKFQYSMISVRDNNGQYGGRDQQFNNVVALRLMYLFKNDSYN